MHFNELETETGACMMPIAPSSPILPPSWVNQGPALSGRTDMPKQVHVNELETETVACMVPIAPSSPILQPSWGPASSGRTDVLKQAHFNESQRERQIGRSEVPQNEHYVLTGDNYDLVLISNSMSELICVVYLRSIRIGVWDMWRINIPCLYAVCVWTWGIREGV